MLLTCRRGVNFQKTAGTVPEGATSCLSRWGAFLLFESRSTIHVLAGRFGPQLGAVSIAELVLAGSDEPEHRPRLQLEYCLSPAATVDNSPPFQPCVMSSAMPLRGQALLIRRRRQGTPNECVRRESRYRAPAVDRLWRKADSTAQASASRNTITLLPEAQGSTGLQSLIVSCVTRPDHVSALDSLRLEMLSDSGDNLWFRHLVSGFHCKVCGR